MGKAGGMADHPDVPESFRAEQVDEKSSRWWLWVVGVLVVGLIAGASVLAVKKKTKAEERAWPASVGGRPAGVGEFKQKVADVKVTAKPGVYLWSDFDGWHLRVVNGGSVQGVHGSIVGDVDHLRAAAAQKGDGTVSLRGGTIDFDLPKSPQLVGVDFEPGFFAKKLTVTLDGANGPIDKSLVTLGSARKPKSLPVVIDKVLKADAPTS
jgi:hypothetical protein